LESAKNLFSRKTQLEWTFAPKIYRIAKNIKSEEIRRPRATFGGSEVLNGNFQYQFEL
jgi:hypothetical protein